MNSLLQIKDTIIRIFEKYEALITPFAKFLLTLSAFLVVNGKIGYESTLASPLLALILALFCALIPLNLASGLLGLYMVVQLYSLALEAALVGLILFLLIFLLYFRFSPRDTVLLLMMPAASLIGMPYILPLIAGLLFTPASAVTVAIGALVSSFVRFIAENETTIGQASEEQEMLDKFRFLVDGIFQNKGMLVMAAAFAAAVIVVYFVRRQRIIHSWSIAVGVGTLVQLIILLIGAAAYNTGYSVGGAILGCILSALIAEIIVFFLFNLDYSRTEEVQFEDDDYYYYVKAIPKMIISTPERRVKTINHSREKDAGRPGGRRGRQEPEEASEDRYDPSEGEYYDDDLEMLDAEEDYEYFDDRN